jgi:hypothetical protein
MAQYVFPTAQLSRIPEILSDSGTISVRPMDAAPLPVCGGSWHRLTCIEGNAVAAASIYESQVRPEAIVVGVSTDLRRLLLLWRIPGDVRLARRLNRLLEREGGELLVEDD